MIRKIRKIGIKTMDELKDFFSLFDLSITINDYPKMDGYKNLEVVSKDGSVVMCIPYDKWECSEKLQFALKPESLADQEFMIYVIQSIIKSLSVKKYISWKTTICRNIPFGTEKIQKTVQIDLPDFSSVEELKIKMASAGLI